MNRPNKKPEVMLFDTVTNDFKDGVSFNDIMISEGFARKDPKWTVHGLLPWEHAFQQLRCRIVIIAISQY